MERLQIPTSELIEIYRFMSVGKLINGLIHNLNGPLHSLGMEMDVLNHLLHAPKKRPGSELIEDISGRLKRMDEQFENLARLIRLSASRMDVSDEHAVYLHLNPFLSQEVEFLKANLYFKHEVRIDLRLAEDIPSFKRPPENLALGLSWFLQGVVEEIERGEMKGLAVETRKVEAGVSVRIEMEGGALSDRFGRVLNPSGEESRDGRIDGADLGMLLALKVLRSSGVDIRSESLNRGPAFTLTIPAPRTT